MAPFTTTTLVFENDGLPKDSCVKCALDVKSALTIRRRIIHAHNYLTEKLQKQSILDEPNQKLTVQSQQTGNLAVELQEVVKPNTLNETAAIEFENVSINRTSSDSQNSETPSNDITPKVEVKLEVLEESQNNYNQKLTVQSQQPGNLAVELHEMVKPNTPNETAAIKCEKLSIDRISFDSQNSETPSYDVTPKVEVKLEVLEESQNNYNAERSIAEEEVKRKATSKPISYTCKVCKISFSNKAEYIPHCRRHKETKCDICNKMIRTDNFQKHLTVHSSSPSVCNLCGATFKNAMSLRGHIHHQHRNQNAYVCEECGQKSNRRYDLLLHQKRHHTGVRNFKCETCGKAFFTKYHLMHHDKMTHKKLRPHICEFCGKGFSAQNALRSHKRQHTNEKPYVCDQCDEGFKQKVSLRAHLESKHGIEEAKECICSECGKGFASNYALSVHQRLHKSLKCEVCSESFAGQEYLNNHMKEAHSVDNDMEECESQRTVEIREELKLEEEQL